MSPRSNQSVHRRLDQYSRRRRMMLALEAQAVGSPDGEQKSALSKLDERMSDSLQVSADAGCGTGLPEQQAEEGTHVQNGKSAGSAVLAEASKVESGVLSREIAGPLPGELNVSLGNPPAKQSRKKFARTSLADQFPGKPITATQGMNRMRGWIHDSQPRVWMFMGDETTAWMRYRGKPGYAEMFRHRLRWELRRQSDLVVNAGSRCAALAEIRQITDQGLEQCRADVVFVMPGREDADLAARKPHLYADQLTELAELIREQGAEPIFQTPPLPIWSGSASAPCPLSALADVIREVSVVRQIPLIDHADFWLEHPIPAAWSGQSLGSLSSLGQTLLALLLFSEFDIYDRQSPLCARLQSAWKEVSQSATRIPPVMKSLAASGERKNKA